ncbi:hypothetical protein KJ991_01820 [Patescibacteria group bacterium]|nr:hypothetical protein [Patescibacteria group bacterium]MBU4057705.1 hypothetical protein [Patescibacteria group bacterium]MBU4115604.1 hypothetical protein [Patescibacteria group bacterium]
MNILNEIILLIFLFGLLGFFADLVVRNIKFITATLKIRLFAVGILLGIITTLPELSIGINAIPEGAASLSVGNIFGGIIVIFGFIVGASLFLNRKVDTSDNLNSLIPASIVIFFSLLLGMDGIYSISDGLMMVFSYAVLLFYLYYANYSFNKNQIVSTDKKEIIKAIFLSIIGVILIMIISRGIVNVSLDLLESLNIRKFTIGLLIFSIGTNIPEITVAITSWRRKASELSLSHLISSSFTNVLVLGVLAVIHPIEFIAGPIFYTTALFLVLILILFIYFSYSQKRLDRREGFYLLLSYLLFLVASIYLVGL